MAIAQALLKYNHNNLAVAETVCPDLVYFQKTIETFQKYNIDTFEKAMKLILDQDKNKGVKKDYNNTKGYDDDLLLEDEWLKEFNKRNA